MIKNIPNQQIRLIADKVVSLIKEDRNYELVVSTLKPILESKIPFPKLDLLGKIIGQAGVTQPERFFPPFDKIIDYNALGSYVIVGQALTYFLKDNFEMVMEKSREYIIKGDEWYFSDTIGHRSLGQALVDYFGQTIPWLETFLRDENKWVRKSVGIAIHCFSHRVLDEPEKIKRLLNLIEPYLEEKESDVVKGIGWGLKTIGKYHPDILVPFLKKQVQAKKNISKLMMRKALTYLDRNKKIEAEKILNKF